MGKQVAVTKGNNKGKKSTAVVKAPWKPLGYLMDNKENLHQMTDAQARKLLVDKVQPSQFTSDGIPVWKIDKGGERYYRKAYHVNDCVFRATKKYMETMGYGTLTNGDLKFFEDHPRVESGGVGRSNALCVIQGLVEPWGLGIERVWMPKWAPLGEQHKQFALALGINPKAAADSETSNAELVSSLELDPDSEFAQSIMACRFEFVDKPPEPSIVLMSGTATVASKGGGNIGGQWTAGATGGFGHADFVGPRDTPGNWQIAISLSRNPVYANGAMPKYGDLSYFGDEIDQKEISKLELSITNSLVNGKAAGDYGKATVVTYPKSTPTNVAAGKPKTNGKGGSQYSQAVMFSPTLTDEPCPWCARKLNSVGDNKYCLRCNWFDLGGVTARDLLCPFCGSYLYDGVCHKKCGFDSSWFRSAIYVCEVHGTDMYYKLYDKATNKGVYLCPECTRNQSVAIPDLYNNRESHAAKKIEETK